MDNDHEVEDLKPARRAPWNKGKLIGAKPPLRPSHVWSVRTKLRMADRKRDLALFNLAIDSKLRGCDVVAVRVDDVAPSGYAMDRATIRQKKTGRPVRFEMTDQTRLAVDDYLSLTGRKAGQLLFAGRGDSAHGLTTRQYTRLVHEWVASIGLDPANFGTHSLRRTKAVLIYRRTGNLRAVQLLLGHSKIESTVRYLGIERVLIPASPGPRSMGSTRSTISLASPTSRLAIRSSTIGGFLLLPSLSLAQAIDPLPSWNDGPAKTAIIEFVKSTADPANSKFVSTEARIATFDQDGTTWVEQPMYPQVMYCLDRVPALAEKKPELKSIEPFKTALSGDRDAMAKLPKEDLMKILAATLSGMTVEDFNADVKTWIETAQHPRFKRLYTDLTYLPMLEVMRLFRDNGYKTYFVTGGGQDFVRVYSQRVYDVPVEQVVGSAGATQFGYDKDGKPILTKEPKALLNDDKAGKPEGIHFVIGRRAVAAFGNSMATKRCWSILREAAFLASCCSCTTTMLSVNTPTGPNQRSEHSATRSWTRLRARAGLWSA